VNYDNSLVVTITVTCYSWAPFIYMWRHLPTATECMLQYALQLAPAVLVIWPDERREHAYGLHWDLKTLWQSRVL